MDNKTVEPVAETTDMMIDFRDTDGEVNSCAVCAESMSTNQKCFNCKLCGKDACSKCFRFKLHDLKACDTCVLSSLTSKLTKSPRKRATSLFDKVQPRDTYEYSLVSPTNLVVFFLDGYCKKIDITKDFTIQDVARIFSKDMKLAMYEVEQDISSGEGYHLLSSDMLVSELYIRWSSLHWKHAKIIIPLYYENWQTISCELSDYSDAGEPDDSLEHDLLDTISQIKKLTRLDSRHSSFRFPKPPAMVSEGTCTEESGAELCSTDIIYKDSKNDNNVTNSSTNTHISTCDTGCDAMIPTLAVLADSSTMPDLTLSATSTATIPTNTELKLYDSIGTTMDMPILCDHSTATETAAVQYSVASTTTDIVEHQDMGSGSSNAGSNTVEVQTIHVPTDTVAANTTNTSSSDSSTTTVEVQTTAIPAHTVATNTSSVTTTDAAIDTYHIASADTGTSTDNIVSITTTSTSTMPILTTERGSDAVELSMQDSSTAMDSTTFPALTTTTASNTTTVHLESVGTETEYNNTTTPTTTTTASNTTTVHLESVGTETERESEHSTSTTVTPTSVVHFESTTTTSNKSAKNSPKQTTNTVAAEKSTSNTKLSYPNANNNETKMINEGTEIDLNLTRPLMCDVACVTEQTLYQINGADDVPNTTESAKRVAVETVDRGSDPHCISTDSTEEPTSNYLRRESLRNHTHTIETMLSLQRSRSFLSSRDNSPQHSIASPPALYGQGFHHSGSSKSPNASDHACTILPTTTTTGSASTATGSNTTATNRVHKTIPEKDSTDLFKPEHEESQYANPLGTNIAGAAHLHLHRRHTPPTVAKVRKIVVNSTYSTPRLASPGTGQSYHMRLSNKLQQVRQEEDLKWEHEHERIHEEEGNWELHRSFESNSSDVYRCGSTSSASSVHSIGSSSGVHSRPCRHSITTSPVGINTIRSSTSGVHTTTATATIEQQPDRRTPLHLVDGGMKLLPPGHPDWAKSRRFSVEFK